MTATLADGQVSVTPSGSKAPAPASFSYKAPDQAGQSATVNLETRSRRGSAKLDLKFTTGLPAWTGEGKYQSNGQNNGISITEDYSFSITFHILPDKTIAGEGVLKKVDSLYGGQGMTCNPIGLAALDFPALQVTGKVKPDGTLYLAFQSQPSTNPWHFECTFATGGSYPLDQGKDPGIGLFEISVAAAEGAQANEKRDIAGIGGVSGGYSWEFVLHQQAVP